jgi:D-serine deaminase-like pyridoxal phosphate-dependent protein
MANAARGAGVALRPHAKAHKCTDIAHLQIERGPSASAAESRRGVRRRWHRDV